ncbi:MAG: DUF4416 family protein [Deltaproteobacteria bacterium]|nr:DUF4416 family protein [Deltaproteobacteria bacterium]
MRPKRARDVKLAVSLVAADEGLFMRAIEALSSRFGQMDFLSETSPFDRTDYYEEEFGGGLKRRFVSFEDLVPPDGGGLAQIKLFTNGVEDEFLAPGGKRRINIDPGIVSLERFVLATCKNFTHRIYLKDGVWADLTLIYTARGFKDLPWTYPDYRVDVMKSWLRQIRARYARQISKGQ